MRAACVMLAGLIIAGCAEMRPGQTSYNRREIPPGPGLFTSEEGEWVIYRKQEPVAAEETTEEPAQN